MIRITGEQLAACACRAEPEIAEPWSEMNPDMRQDVASLAAEVTRFVNEQAPPITGEQIHTALRLARAAAKNGSGGPPWPDVDGFTWDIYNDAAERLNAMRGK